MAGVEGREIKQRTSEKFDYPKNCKNCRVQVAILIVKIIIIVVIVKIIIVIGIVIETKIVE